MDLKSSAVLIHFIWNFLLFCYVRDHEDHDHVRGYSHGHHRGHDHVSQSFSRVFETNCPYCHLEVFTFLQLLFGFWLHFYSLETHVNDDPSPYYSDQRQRNILTWSNHYAHHYATMTQNLNYQDQSGTSQNAESNSWSLGSLVSFWGVTLLFTYFGWYLQYQTTLQVSFLLFRKVSWIYLYFWSKKWNKDIWSFSKCRVSSSWRAKHGWCDVYRFLLSPYETGLRVVDHQTWIFQVSNRFNLWLRAFKTTHRLSTLQNKGAEMPEWRNWNVKSEIWRTQQIPKITRICRRYHQLHRVSCKLLASFSYLIRPKRCLK